MNLKLLKIYNFFGSTEQKAKVAEEKAEFVKAYYTWFDDSTKGNLLHLIDELNDMTILISQHALQKGISVQEMESMLYNKLGRTIEIIDKLNKLGMTKEDYPEIRRNYE